MPQEAGPITGVLWKSKSTPDIEFDYRKMKIKVDARGTAKLSGTLSFSDLEKFGTITISKGALEWWPSNAKKPFRMDWTRFDRAIREHYGY